jgi:hypothetical protein
VAGRFKGDRAIGGNGPHRRTPAIIGVLPEKFGFPIHKKSGCLLRHPPVKRERASPSA